MSFLKDHIGRRVNAVALASSPTEGTGGERAGVPSPTEVAAAQKIVRFLWQCRLRRHEVAQWVLAACAEGTLPATATTDCVVAEDEGTAATDVRRRFTGFCPFLRLTHFALLRARQHRLLIRPAHDTTDSDSAALQAVAVRLFTLVREEVTPCLLNPPETIDQVLLEDMVHAAVEVCAVVFYTQAVAAVAAVAPVRSNIGGFVNGAFLKCVQLALDLFSPHQNLWASGEVPPGTPQRAAVQRALLDSLGAVGETARRRVWSLLSPTSSPCLTGVLAQLSSSPAASLGTQEAAIHATFHGSASTGGGVAVPLVALVRACFVNAFAARSPQHGTFLPHAPSAVCAKALLTLLHHIHRCSLACHSGPIAGDLSASVVTADVAVRAVVCRLLLADLFFLHLSSAVVVNTATHYAGGPLLSSFLSQPVGGVGRAPSATATRAESSPPRLQCQIVRELTTGHARVTTALAGTSTYLRSAYMELWLALCETERLDGNITLHAPRQLTVLANPFEAEAQLLVRLSVAHAGVRSELSLRVGSEPHEDAEAVVRDVCWAALSSWKTLLSGDADCEVADEHLVSTAEREVLQLLCEQRPTHSAIKMPKPVHARLSAAPFTAVGGPRWCGLLAALVELSVLLWQSPLRDCHTATTWQRRSCYALHGEWMAETLHAWRLKGECLAMWVDHLASTSPHVAAADVRRQATPVARPRASLSIAAQQAVVRQLVRAAAQLEASAVLDGLAPCFRVLWETPVALLLSTPVDSAAFLATLSEDERLLVACHVATRCGHGDYEVRTATPDRREVSEVTAESPARRTSGSQDKHPTNSALRTVTQLVARLGEAVHLVSRDRQQGLSTDEKDVLRVCEQCFTDHAHDTVAALEQRRSERHGLTRLSRLRLFTTPDWIPIAGFLVRLSAAGVRSIGVSYLLNGGLSITGFFHHCCSPPEAWSDGTAGGSALPKLHVLSPSEGNSGEIGFTARSPATSTPSPLAIAPCELLSLLHSPSTLPLLEAYTKIFSTGVGNRTAPSGHTATARTRHTGRETDSFSSPNVTGLWRANGPPLEALHAVQIAYSTLGSMLVSVLMLQGDAGLSRGEALPLPALRTATYLSNFYVLSRTLIIDSMPSTAPTVTPQPLSWTALWQRIERDDVYSTCAHFAQTLKLLSTRSVRVEQLAPLLSTFSPKIDATFTEAKLARGDHAALACLFALPHLFPFATRVAVLRGHIKQCAAQYATSAVHVYRTFTGQLVAFRTPEKFRLSIRRDNVLGDALTQVRHARATMARSQLLYSAWHITFVGADGIAEVGIDLGGLFKEFWELCVQELLDPGRGLFMTTASEEGGEEEGVVLAGQLYPNPHAAATVGSQAAAEELFAFTGLLLAKGVSEGLVVPTTFANFFMSNLLGTGVSLEDLGDLDPVEYRSLLRLRDMEKVEEASLFFAYEDNYMGTPMTHDLIPHGRHVPVTNENVVRYLHLYANYRLATCTDFATEAFRDGFLMLLSSLSPSTDVSVGVRLLRLFNAVELRQLFSGAEVHGAKAVFDVDDLERHTVCQGGSRRTVRFLFTVLRELSPRDQGLFLRFCTGSSRPPLLGFGAMQPPFTITGSEEAPQQTTEAGAAATPLGVFSRLFRGSRANSRAVTARLPTASTCFNLLHLPAYESAETLKARLLVAIRADAGFGLS